jgi:hypothetical protein
MNEREGMTQAREGQETTRAKGGKGKAVAKRSKADTPLPQQESRVEAHRPAPDRPVSEGSEGREAQDPQLMVRIQQQAYLLFEAGGFEHGHDLEHWLEAERQIASNGPER